MDARQRLSQMRRRVAQGAYRCHQCGHPYAPENVTVLGREADVWFVALRCRACRRRVYAAATFRERRVHRAGRGEAGAGTGRPPTIRPNDVESMRSFLNKFDGDFQKLFGSS